MSEVDADVRDAARGMGMNGRQMVRSVELPLASPLIMAGIRSSAVAVVATATLLAYVGGGGLGRFIIDGSRISYDDPRVFVGALFVALLSVAVELVLGLIERVTVPRSLRTRDAFVPDDATRVVARDPIQPQPVSNQRKEDPMRSVRLRPTGRAVGVLLLALVLIASGCGGDDDDDSSSATSSGGSARRSTRRSCSADRRSAWSVRSASATRSRSSTGSTSRK